MVTYMFDSNVFDKILDNTISTDTLSKAKIKGASFAVTHIQHDEIQKCPDVKKRSELLKIFSKVNAENKPTESIVFGHSRFGQAKFGNGKLLEKIRGKNVKKTNDALIGETAIKNDFILVSEDKILRNKIKSLDCQAINVEDFLNENK